jgi:hypothetical protein
MAEKAEAGTETVSEVPTHQRDGIVSVALANYKIEHRDIAVRDLRELVLRPWHFSLAMFYWVLHRGACRFL